MENVEMEPSGNSPATSILHRYRRYLKLERGYSQNTPYTSRRLPQ